MAKKGVIALMACVFALCLALVGCGGGGSNDEANKAAFTGTWNLVEMNQDGQVTGSDDLETLKALGLEVYVNLNEDGTAALVLFGEVMDGTWTASSATAGTLTMEGQDVAMTIEDSKLKFEQEGASLTFEKGEAKETPSASESESATAEESSEAAEGESSEAAPAEGESASAEGEAAPAEGESASAEGEAAPAEGESAAESSSSTEG